MNIESKIATDNYDTIWLLAIGIVMLLLSLSYAHADAVQLKDGRVLTGRVTEKNNRITVITDDNQLYQFNKDEIEDIKRGENMTTEKKADTELQKQTSTNENPVITISTSVGDIKAVLYEDKVPNTVANIISLAENDFYKGLKFHRIIPGFMAQGGCPNTRQGAGGMPGTGGPDYRIADEFDATLRHDTRGILSMANSGPNTNGSQFFITFTATPHLNDGHTVFGKVTEGMDVLDKLEAAGTGQGKPTEDIEFNITVDSKQDHAYEVKKL